MPERYLNPFWYHTGLLPQPNVGQVVGSNPAPAATYGPWASPSLAVACGASAWNSNTIPVLWVVVDLKRDYRNIQSEWMNLLPKDPCYALWDAWNMTIANSAKATIHATLVIWAKAHIPTQRIDSCMRKLRKLYDDYSDLKRNRLTQKECSWVKEQLFKSDLDELFDISTKDALAMMSNEEDKQFLLMMRDDPSSASIASIDKSFADKEVRRNRRIAQ